MPAQGSQDWIKDYPTRTQTSTNEYGFFSVPTRATPYLQLVDKCTRNSPFSYVRIIVCFNYKFISFVKDMYMTHTEQGTFFRMKMSAPVDF